MHLSIGSNQDDFVSLYCRKGSVDYDPVVELAAVGVSWGHVNSVKFTSEGKLIVNPQYTRTLLFASYYYRALLVRLKLTICVQRNYLLRVWLACTKDPSASLSPEARHLKLLSTLRIWIT
ncbi:hypothetical protein ABKN59_007455 [Abortiporus biennis]